MRRILYILALALSIVACTEEIDKSNRYTFTGETVADFMRFLTVSNSNLFLLSLDTLHMFTNFYFISISGRTIKLFTT